MRRRYLAVVPILLLSLLLIPSAPVQGVTSTSNCPSAVMTYFAIPLSQRVNGLQSNLTSVSSNSEIAAEVDQYLPLIATSLNFSIPLLTSSDKGLPSLIGPFQTFLTASHNVNPSQPQTACTFLIYTAEFGAYAVMLATGNFEVGTFVSMFNEVGHDCGSACQTEVENAVYNFATNTVPNDVSGAKQAICGSKYIISGICGSPEFPFAFIPAILLTGLIPLFYLVLRNRASYRPSASSV